MQKRRGEVVAEAAGGATGPVWSGPRLLLFVPLVGLLLQAGCAGTNKSKVDNSDPLLGPPALPTQAAASTATPAGTPVGSPLTPPQPALSGAPSTASLASGNPPRYDTDNSLRISGGSPGTPPSGTWQGPNTGGPVALRGPDAIPVNRPDPVGSYSGALPPGARVGSFEQGMALLQHRGVTWYKLESWGDTGEVKFSCSIPNRQNKFISRTYEARGTDRLTAVQAALNQIDKDQ